MTEFPPRFPFLIAFGNVCWYTMKQCGWSDDLTVIIITLQVSRHLQAGSCK